LHKESTPRMKDNSRTLITIGFLAVLGLMFSLTAISLMELHNVNNSMEHLVEVTNKKTAAANEMRDAIRLRADSLKKMQLTDDLFERDEEYQRIISNAGKFRIAREQLVGLGMNEKEAEVNAQLLQLIRVAQPFVDTTSDMLMSDASAEELEPTIKRATALQQVILDKLDLLVELERQNTEHALAVSRENYVDTRKLLFLLAGVALLFSLLVARIVIKYVSQKNRQLTYQASHDALTGLINRREFESRVERAIQHAKIQASTHALMYLDLDQFKVVNDTCGHAAGDELLQQLAQLLLSTVRHRDTLSRLGGDEFGMLLDNCPLDKAVTIANNLLQSVDDFHFNWGESTFTLGVSIGVVPLDHSTQDIAGAMSAADSACYIAKEAGRNQVQIAHLGDRRLQQHQGEMQWVSRLTRALEESQFELYYQPIVPCTDRNTRGRFLEILLRMIDDDGSVISPRTFLPAAEKYNLASAIDRWVVEHSMHWLAENSSSDKWPITISINLSGQTIGNQDMLKFIINTMDETGIKAEQIIFEVTETATINNIAAATSFMLTLRGCGFRFALDDFGSGLSSFFYLKKLPVDFLKIDGTFIRDILSDPVDYAMVRSITELGQLLGKQTIAEHVETLQVAEELRSIGVDFMQGHAYAKSEPLDNFTHHTRPQLVLLSR
jgi:diguanylate cyclase (GGDEF)-like protein